ncbi:hypothetical protein [Limnobacter litoralis]|uniref:Rad50/SbcC-type AAA domain-containing protein n=1 Tax=Limnobacter litoralis TaxID=481366 RepID=A0ABQ5YSY7_9BURK|nr:hypothetical protein [Limnobacter litoralis]GLR26541.1 hypothetical protein GCM10007875_16310 [Limnobacter litoralis]
MRINSIQVDNFLRVQHAEIRFQTPVVLVAGHNRQGKSSLGEALKHAFIEEPTRVTKKNEFKQLVRDGEKVSSIVIEHSQGTTSLVLPKGEGEGQISHGALPYCLEPSRFATADANTRREFVLKLTGTKITPATIIAKLKERGVNEKKADEVVPLLAAGISSAQAEAAKKATEAKGAWRAVTGETYGSEKAKEWSAPVPQITMSDDDIKSLEKDLTEIGADIDDANQRLGALQNVDLIDVKAIQEEINQARQQGQLYARIQDKLLVDEAQLADWKTKVEQAKSAASGKREGLIHDMARALDFLNGVYTGDWYEHSGIIARYEAEHGAIGQQGDPELAGKLPEYQKALDLIQRSVDNGKRDLAAADAAAKLVVALEEKVKGATNNEENAKAKNQIEANLQVFRDERKLVEDKLKSAKDERRQIADSNSRTKLAAGHHADVQAWDEIAKALKPDGIPAEFVGQAVNQLNTLIATFSEVAQWGQIHISENMEIVADGHEYRLLSESHKWRVDTLIACAIAAISELGFVILDRVDVLDNPGRIQLINLIDDLVANKDLEGALLLATLKEKPHGLPDHITVEWIENGVIQSEEVAA